MPMISMNIHDATELRARANFKDATGWLTIQFGDSSAEHITIFMPFVRAEYIANAINKAEGDYEAWLAEQAEDQPQRNTYADEHRLRQYEVI